MRNDQLMCYLQARNIIETTFCDEIEELKRVKI